MDAACRTLVRQLGESGWLSHAIGGVQYGASTDEIDTRAVCIIRETLAEYSGLADFSFGMQGLGSGAITLFGSDRQKRAYLPRVAKGSRHRGVRTLGARRRLRRGRTAVCGTAGR